METFTILYLLSLTHSSILILWSKDTDQAEHQSALCSLLAFLVIDSQNPAVQIVSMDLFFDFAFILCFFLGGPFVSSIGQWQRMHQIIQVYNLTFQALKAKMLNMHKHAFICFFYMSVVGPLKWKPMGSTNGAPRWFLVLGTWEFWFKPWKGSFPMKRWKKPGNFGQVGLPQQQFLSKMCRAPVGLQLPTHLRSAVRLLLWSQPVNRQDACSLVRIVLSKRFEPTKWIVQ